MIYIATLPTNSVPISVHTSTLCPAVASGIGQYIILGFIPVTSTNRPNFLPAFYTKHIFSMSKCLSNLLTWTLENL